MSAKNEFWISLMSILVALMFLSKQGREESKIVTQKIERKEQLFNKMELIHNDLKSDLFNDLKREKAERLRKMGKPLTLSDVQDGIKKPL